MQKESMMGGPGVPEHIKKMAEENPDSVTIMEWTPEKEFPALAASTVTSYVKFVQEEYVKLLHTTSSTDEELRTRLCTHAPVNAFKEKYTRVFEKITTREIATNPRLMSPILFQLHLLEQVQSGKISEDQARASVADSALNAVVSEARSRGHHMEDIPPKPSQ